VAHGDFRWRSSGPFTIITPMDRAELERLDRDALIRMAEEAGVSRPSILTRPELVDELLLRTAPRRDDPTLRKVRGFFGLARDLLASVIDRGLHLPDAADRIRSVRGPAPPSAPRTAPSVLPTVTLAEIYAAQGHRDRALETLRRVLEREPDHDAARALAQQLEDASYASPAPPLPPEAEEDDAPTAKAETNGVGREIAYEPDECVALPVDSTTLFVCWDLREATLGRLRAQGLGGGERAAGGRLVLRLLVIAPAWDGPTTSTRDVEVNDAGGEALVRDLPAPGVVRAAIGWRTDEAFLPLAHSPLLEAPAGGFPGGVEGLLRWTPDGIVPLAAADADAPSIRRAIGRFRPTNGRQAAGA
jgi:hypothetical protein